MRAEVVDSAGTRVGEATHPGIGDVCRYARAEGLPMLAHVDESGVTRFTQAQMRLVIPELRTVSGRAPAEVADAADAVLGLVDVMFEKVARYLVFAGN